jgi:Glycosyltransferase family 87
VVSVCRTWILRLIAGTSAVWFVVQPVRVLRHITGSWYLYSITAARILASGSQQLYSATLQAKTLSAYLGSSVSAADIVPFERPPIEALLLLPLAGFDLHTSHLIFSIVSLGFVAAASWLLFHCILPLRFSRSFRAMIVGVTVCSVSAATGLWGDESPLLLLPAAGSFILSEREKNFSAGLCLGVILLMRPQLVWLLPILAIGARQWRLFAGLLLGGVVLLASSLLILGPAHFMEWPSALFHADVQNQQVFTFGIPGWIGYTFSSPDAAYVSFGLLAAAAVAVAWRFGSRLAQRPELMIAGGLAASLATALHVEPWNFILLAMPLSVWARTHPYGAVLTVLGMDAVQILTFGQYGPPVEYLLALGPVAVAAGLWTSQVRLGARPVPS